MARSRVRSISRKSTPLSPRKAPPAAPTPDASKPNKRKTRSASREIITAPQQLQIVDSILPPVTEREEELAPEHTSNVDNVLSLLGASSTGSSLQELLDALDRGVIIDNLRNLYDDSISLMSLFEKVDEEALQDMCDSTKQPNPRLLKRFQNQKQRLVATRASYGSNHYGGPLDFVKPDLILRKILGRPGDEAIPYGLWRPDAVLFLANLALQVVKVLSPSTNDHASYVSLMFGNFPQPFVDFGYFQPSLETYDGVCELLVEILTQAYLNKVESEHGQADFDPDNAMMQVFYDSEGRLKACQHPTGQSKALDRVRYIRQHFDKDPETVIDFEGLKDHFTWSDFAVRVVKWTLCLKMELEEFIESRGGIGTIADLILAGNFESGTVEGQATIFENDQAYRRSDDPFEQDAWNELNKPEEETQNSTRVPQRGATPKNQRQNSRAYEPVDSHPNDRRPLPDLAGVPKRGEHLKSDMDKLRAVKTQFAIRKSGLPSDIGSQGETDSVRGVTQSLTPAGHDDGNDVGLNEEQEAYEDEGAAQNYAQDDAGDEEQVMYEGEGRVQDETEDEDDAEEEDIIATQQTKLIHQTIQRQLQQSNKENAHDMVKKKSLFDRQDGAERVQWDPTFPVPEDIHQPTRQSSKRPRRPVDPGSDENDSGFETNTRVAKKPRVAAGRNRMLTPPRAVLQELEEDPEETSGNNNGRQAQPRTLASRPREGASSFAARDVNVVPEGRQRTIPSSSQPERMQITTSSRAPSNPASSSNRGLPSSSAPTRSRRTALSQSPPRSRRLPPSHQEQPGVRSLQPSPSQEPPSTQAQRANREAKERVRMARDLMQHRRPVQNRRAYTADEVDRLMELIAMYGTQWARILVEDRTAYEEPKLQERSQGNLKDKARNIKLDWLKSGKRLEPGFEYVSVGNSKIEALRQLGINYFEGENAARYVGRGNGDFDDDVED